MKLCDLHDIKIGAARAFRVSEQSEIFIIRHGEQLLAYYNRCPHTGAPLNWLPDQFLDNSGAYIQCSGHDALFRIEDGLCVHGPCHGRSLSPVTVTVAADQIFLKSSGQE